ncbi:hypothetical protein EHH54_34730 [Rhizobium leguminosarum]|uniref:hypothetical protein n=1 Tax=Rhizobium leguminosarum TaxID=384 RepID=UPI000FEC6FF9|nr:hypothetical protein [Rhizobium leguminosarum]RWX26623.1 hypothetical protein EHH54_34730 [Rhizobium leguminosarum]
MSGPVCECTFFDEGDWVESRLNPDIFGIVVSNSDFGRFVHVQLASTLEMRNFYAVTLQHMDEGDEPPLQAAEPKGADVIDFTKERALRKTTKTEGAA